MSAAASHSHIYSPRPTVVFFSSPFTFSTTYDMRKMENGQLFTSGRVRAVLKSSAAFLHLRLLLVNAISLQVQLLDVARSHLDDQLLAGHLAYVLLRGSCRLMHKV